MEYPGGRPVLWPVATPPKGNPGPALTSGTGAGVPKPVMGTSRGTPGSVSPPMPETPLPELPPLGNPPVGRPVPGIALAELPGPLPF